MRAMFHNCRSLQQLDLSSFHTSNMNKTDKRILKEFHKLKGGCDII